jgi:ribosome maturation factor RimP
MPTLLTYHYEFCEGETMAKQPVNEMVANLAEPHAAALGLEVVDVQFLREGGQRILRVLIDREGGISLDDCEALSKVLGEELDRADPIPYGYCLEVSSPGVERPLKKEQDFRRFAGRLINCRLYSPLQGRKNFSGILLGLEGHDVLLQAETPGIVRLPLASVASARLVFNDGSREGGKVK